MRFQKKKKDDSGIRFRVSDTERKKLIQAAQDHCMSLSEYIRFKIFEVETFNDHTSNHREYSQNPMQFLAANLPLFGRVILDGYFHIVRLAQTKLSDEELRQINTEAEETFAELGPERGLNQLYGSNSSSNIQLF